MIDYIAIMQGYHGQRSDGYLTDTPVGVKLAEDDIVRVRYDANKRGSVPILGTLSPAMRWIPNRPSRIKYPKAKQLIEQYRKEIMIIEVNFIKIERSEARKTVVAAFDLLGKKKIPHEPGGQ